MSPKTNNVPSKALLMPLVIFILFTAGINKCHAQVDSQININDSLALVDLYNSTNGPGWTNNTNWLTSEPVSTWYGVSVLYDRVIGLYFFNNHLDGPLPASITNLSMLRWLDLWVSPITGSIPANIGNLTNLEELVIEGTQIKGAIPASLTNLVKLTKLRLSSVQLSGAIPANIGNLVSLTDLSIANTQLTGSLPSSIGRLTNLKRLEIVEKNLSGQIPDSIGYLSNLEYMFFLGPFNGQIPSSIGNLTKLGSLTAYCDFSGPIPASLSNLANNLSSLSLGGYSPGGPRLTGLIPSYFSSFTKLKGLLLEGQFTGSIPSSVGNISNLEALAIRSDQLTGTIPSSIANLTQLQSLDITGQQITGTLQPVIGYLTNLTKLKTLYIKRTQISGPIPPELGNIKSITDLRLDNNKLSGPIPPELGNLDSIESIMLRANQLSGEIPTALTNLTKLGYLSLDSNKLTGGIPSFANAPMLQSLGLGDNDLDGEISPDIVSAPVLLGLYIYRNRFIFNSNLENIASGFAPTVIFAYHSQHKVALQSYPDGSYSVSSVGDNIMNDTVHWVKNGTVIATIAGDTTFTPAPGVLQTGDKFFAYTTNSIATQLTLYSDTIIINAGGAPSPIITSFGPTTAGAGATITIKGKYFTGAGAVKFGGMAAASFKVTNDSTIKAVTGNGATGDVAVTSAGGTGVLAGFNFCTLVTPSVTIKAAPKGTVCTGTSITFTATPVNGGANPTYQWYKNNVKVGANSDTYTDNALNNGDNIWCVLTSNAPCVTKANDKSNVIVCSIAMPGAPGVNIIASTGTAICPGVKVGFKATPVNGGPAPAYQWYKNNLPVSANSATYNDATLNENDSVWCIITSNANCLAVNTAKSNVLIITYTAPLTPTIKIKASTGKTICAGTTVTFTSIIENGGTNPVYQWYRQGVKVGTNASMYSDNAINNGDGIWCVLTSKAACVTKKTAKSNIIAFKVNTCIAYPSSDGDTTAPGSSSSFKNTTLPAGKGKALLYPNPALSDATLQLSGYKGLISVVVTDISGKTLLRMDKLNNGTHSLKLGSIANGVYLVTIVSESGKETLRLVKAK